MNRALQCGVVFLLASSALAGEPVKTTTSTAGTSSLVAAAAAARASKPRKSSRTKVITNADVKRAHGKLTPSKTGAAAPPAGSKPGMLEVQDQQRKARAEAAVRLAAAQKKVDALEKDLRRIEQSFYDENDPSYRDDVIQKSFNQTKRQLDDARKELADARDASGKAAEAN